MELKKLLLLGLASTFILAACDDTETETETAVKTDDTTEEVVDEETTEETEDEEPSEDIEEVVESDEDLPEQQVGDVIEDDGMTRTVIATSYGINEDLESGPFTVSLRNSQISHLEITDEDTADYFGGDDLVMVSMQLDVQNDSTDTNTIYPDQGTIVTNTGNQIDADIWMSDSVGGDFLGEVTKSGDVFFFFEGDPEEISNVRYIIGSGHDEDFNSFGDDIEFSVDY